jgi:hypothetical protein
MKCNLAYYLYAAGKIGKKRQNRRKSKAMKTTTPQTMITMMKRRTKIMIRGLRSPSPSLQVEVGHQEAVK